MLVPLAAGFKAKKSIVVDFHFCRMFGAIGVMLYCDMHTYVVARTFLLSAKLLKYYRNVPPYLQQAPLLAQKVYSRVCYSRRKALPLTIVISLPFCASD